MAKTDTRTTGPVLLCLATLVGWAPVIGILVGAALSSLLGCRVDEGSVRPCVVGGVDVGYPLYLLLVSGWFILGTWPIILVTTLLWLWLVVRFVLRRLRT
jgi:hypothetical protein